MRRSLIRLGALVILSICLWGHVSELFDTWDHTLETGRDIEYSSVIVVLVAGAVIVAPVRALLLFWRRAMASTFVSRLIGTVLSLLATPVLLTPSPPNLSLRV